MSSISTGPRLIKKVRKDPITSKQKEILVEFISQRKEMYTGKLSPSYTKEKMKENWNELTNILNSIPNASAKDWKDWRKTWVDLKKNTKAKLSNEKKYATGTGGGPPLPPMEEKLLEIITPVAISGNEEIDESSVPFQLCNSDNEMADVKSCGPKIISQQIIQVEDELPSEYLDGHDYCISGMMASAKTPIPTPVRPKRKRITKTTRLQESLKHNDRFLKLTEKNLEAKEKKIEIIKQKCEIKESYYNQKLITLERLTDAVAQIANASIEIATILKK